MDGDKLKATHISIVSDNALQNAGDKFINDFLQNHRVTKKKKKKTTKRSLFPALNNSSSHCSTIKLKDCIVCMSEVADGVFMPCGHGGICYDCAL